jgi:hypothetical protein
MSNKNDKTADLHVGSVLFPSNGCVPQPPPQTSPVDKTVAEIPTPSNTATHVLPIEKRVVFARHSTDDEWSLCEVEVSYKVSFAANPGGKLRYFTPGEECVLWCWPVQTARVAADTSYGKTLPEHSRVSEMLAREDELDSAHARESQPRTDGNRAPEVSPRANLACVTLVFLEDWQAGHLTADEVCETLLAAAITRGLLGETVPTAKKPEPARKIEVDFESHSRLVGLAMRVSKNTSDVDSRELADGITHFANDSELNVVVPIDAKNFDHMVETAQMILKENDNVNERELAELFLHLAKEKP